MYHSIRLNQKQSIRLMAAGLALALLFSALLGGTSGLTAQEQEADVSPREAILASIPSLIHFEEQAEGTFVGDVEGSYAFIAFVIRDGFAVVYLCDNVLISAWLSGEIVDGVLDVQTESGIHVIATISDDYIEGSVTLTTDDDGTPAQPHAFTAIPAVPGETGLARYVWEDGSGVSGWIVTEKGIRGKKSTSKLCRDLNTAFFYYVDAAFDENATLDTTHFYVETAYEISQVMVKEGCEEPRR